MFCSGASVRILIRFFRRIFFSSAETSASSTGRMRGSISMTVTSVPKREKIEANSMPTAPAPTMRSDLGTALQIQDLLVGQDDTGRPIPNPGTASPPIRLR